MLLGFTIVALLLLPTFGKQPWFYWTARWGVLRAIPSFGVGMWLYSIRGHLARLPWPRAIAVGCLIGFLLLGRVGVNGNILLVALYATVAAAVAADFSGSSPRLAFGRFGQLTYSLYMIHPIVLTVGLTFIGRRLLHLHGLAADLGVLAAIGATILLAYFSLLYFETPARHLIAGTKRRRSA